MFEPEFVWLGDKVSAAGVTGVEGIDFCSTTGVVVVGFFGDSSVSVFTVSSNVALLSSALLVGGKRALRRPPWRRVLTTRARVAPPRRPRARRAALRGTPRWPRPETAADSSVSSASSSSPSTSSCWFSPISRVDDGTSSGTEVAIKQKTSLDSNGQWD